MARRWARRSLLAAAAAVGAGALSAACGGQPAGRATVHLRLHAPGSEGLFARVLPPFERAHPGVRVDVSVASAATAGSLQTALVAGSGPDVFWDSDPAAYLGGPLCSDLAPLAQRTGYDLSGFGAALLGAFRYGGGLYMLPRTVSPGAYAARLDLIGQARGTLPAGDYGYDALAALWRAVTQATKALGGRLVWTPDSTFYLNGWDAHLVDPSVPGRVRCALGTPAALSCGEWVYDRFWRDSSALGVPGDGPDTAADFWQGTLAMEVVTAATLVPFAGRSVDVPWRLLPFPRWPAGPATSADTDFYAISSASPHQDLAWDLLTEAVSASWQQAAIDIDHLAPSRGALYAQYTALLARLAPPLARQPLDLFTTAVRGDWVRPRERFRYEASAATILDRYWHQIFGPGNEVAVAQGFAAAATAIDQAEARAGKT